MTALVLIALGLHDLLDAVLPHRWPAARRAGTVLGLAGAATVAAAALMAVVSAQVLTPAVGSALVALALLAVWSRVGAGRSLGVAAVVAVVALVAVLEASLVPPGHRAAPAAFTIVGVALALTETGNRITRAVLALAGRRADGASGPAAAGPPQDGLRGGRYIGPMERILMSALGLAQAYPVIAALMAAKGIVRFPEISADRGEGSRAEEFLIGSLASWSLAGAGGLLVWLSLGAPALGGV